MSHPIERHMRRAIDLAAQNKASGGYAVAAVIVDESGVLAEAVTTLTSEPDPTAHAEINALRAACRKTGSRFLPGAYLYSTFEPCPMCASAMVWGKLEGIVYGASMADATTSHPQRIALRCADVVVKGTPLITIFPEFLRQECLSLLNGG